MNPQAINPNNFLSPAEVQILQDQIGVVKPYYTIDEIRIALEQLMPRDERSIWSDFDLHLLDKYTLEKV